MIRHGTVDFNGLVLIKFTYNGELNILNKWIIATMINQIRLLESSPSTLERSRYIGCAVGWPPQTAPGNRVTELGTVLSAFPELEETLVAGAV
jgi:hypothetical protein